MPILEVAHCPSRLRHPYCHPKLTLAFSRGLIWDSPIITFGIGNLNLLVEYFFLNVGLEQRHFKSFAQLKEGVEKKILRDGLDTFYIWGACENFR